MGLLGGSIGGSPIQEHSAYVATDLYAASGNLETLGSPHPYINQDGLLYLRLNEAQVAPWSFTGVRAKQTPLFLAQRSKIQVLIFNQQETIDLLKAPPRTEKVMFYFPLLIMQGDTPFLGDSQLVNFIEAWKGQFLPIYNASIHLLVDGPLQIPNRVPLIYINRDHIQGYLKA